MKATYRQSVCLDFWNKIEFNLFSMLLLFILKDVKLLHKYESLCFGLFMAFSLVGFDAEHWIILS